VIYVCVANLKQSNRFCLHTTSVLFSREMKFKVVLKFDWTVVEHVSDTYLTKLDLIW